MNILRILLVESDDQQAHRLLSTLASAGHSAVPVATIGEAIEALFIQKFDLVLLGSPQPAVEMAAFSATLRELAETARPRTLLLCSSHQLEASPHVDGYLPRDFDPARLDEFMAPLPPAPENGRPAEQQATALYAVFESAAFEEQCAHERELMIEIIDLFREERERELPNMGESLGAGDFERLSRIAHTIKGSLGSLHAPAAWQRAQALEMAAKQRNLAACAEILDAFERDLEHLERQLSAFRATLQTP